MRPAHGEGHVRMRQRRGEAFSTASPEAGERPCSRPCLADPTATLSSEFCERTRLCYFKLPPHPNPCCFLTAALRQVHPFP